MQYARTAKYVEWPTIALAAGIYLAFGLLTWFHEALPIWALFLLGGYVVALHSSLQHEVVHGHPTPWRRLNEALIFPSLWLWLPFPYYRETHLLHHRDEQLTLPGLDPESYYLAAEDWAAAGPLGRAFYRAMNTFLGRVLLSPFRNLVLVAKVAVKRLAAGEPGERTTWGLHLLAMALPLLWALAVCGLPLWTYLLCFAYAGSALAQIRSFLEHRAVPAVGERTVAVEAGPLMSLLFLNNNLHVLHHAEPGLAWYKLPARWRQRRAELLARNGGYRYGGYLEIAWRYALKPKESPLHPTFPAPAPQPVAVPETEGTATSALPGY